MSECKMKDSRIVISEVMMPSQANPNGNVHGGEIMKLMDSAAYAAARRYARSNVVTARVDELEFHLPIRIGDLVVVTADIVYVGHSSMEISVNVIVEDLDEGSDPQLGLSAYFTMVALDRNARPKAVPPLELKTEEARVAFEEGKRRYEAHKARKRGVTIPTGGCVCDAIAQQAKAASEQREAEKQ
ncbi:MAG: acyl-CoA thioesterase [Selenomonas sp.]|nr:acyl-CoA thioesterase [Selenomonas sp.]